jgi:acyl-CoA reductase-like NAD-dependent aldehyde dehydrogenase
MPLMRDDESGLNVVPLWINGKATTSLKPIVFPVHSATHNKAVYLAQGADSQTACIAAESALIGFEKWKRKPAAERRKVILRAADIIEKRQKELIDIQIEETSCSQTWAEFNIKYTLNALPEIASRTTTACTGELPPMAAEGTLGLVLKVPIGPVLLIAP